MCKACFDLNLNKDISILRKIIERKKQTILESACGCDCRCLEEMVLEVSFFESMYRLLKYNDVSAPIEDTFEALKAFNQTIMDEMLMDQTDPGLRFQCDNGSYVNFSDQPSESIRVHGQDMLKQLEIYQGYKDNTYEMFAEKLEYYFEDLLIESDPGKQENHHVLNQTNVLLGAISVA